MKVLVINCGSSSLKYQLIDSQSEEVLAKGLCERIGIEGSSVTHQKAGEGKKTEAVLMKDHTDAVKVVIEKLTDPAEGVIASLKEIDAVGHRIVHGGEKFKGSVVIDDSVLEAIAECNDLAPLHNPANLIGIRSCQKVMPGVPMPGKAYLYGLPYEYYEKYKVRRYGFHGTSHDFVSKRVGELLGKDRKDLKIIVCHLGNGASVSAVDHGKSVDTSMGLTPLEGLMMGTRSGDMHPAIVGFIAEKEQLTAAEVIDICNKKSGVLGLSGISSDFRDLVEAAAAGNDHAQTTLEAYAYRVGKYIGAYAAAMNGVDAIVFTAGIGENNAQVRALISQYTGFLGCEIDLEKNKAAVGVEAVISTPESKVTALVVPTNEELAIARETVRLVNA